MNTLHLVRCVGDVFIVLANYILQLIHLNQLIRKEIINYGLFVKLI